MKQQLSRTAFFILVTSGVGTMLYAIQHDSKGTEMIGLMFGMVFHFWLASSLFNDAFKNETDA